jgi:hypothetical protein
MAASTAIRSRATETPWIEVPNRTEPNRGGGYLVLSDDEAMIEP